MRSTEFRAGYIGKLILLLAMCSSLPQAWCAAATPADPGTIAVTADGITYFAQGGDTLLSIARKLSTKPANWVAIGKLNRIDKSSNIPIGTGIFIPAEMLAEEARTAKVIALSGTVAATGSHGGGAVLALGTTVSEGMQIETGNSGFLTLVLQDGSRISLPSNSRVRLAKLSVTRYTNSAHTDLMLLRGRVESRVAPLESSRGRFEVRTPHSVAGVRGTHFRVGLVEQGVANEVLTGRVAVGNAKNANALTLAAGQGNVIGANKIGAPIDLLPAPALADKTTREFAAARFALSTIAGAATYRVQVATDPDAQNVLAENRANRSQVTLAGIPDGNYFLRLSAIDKAGLEGSPGIVQITLKNRAEAILQIRPSPPFVDVSDDKGFTLRWSAPAGQKFALQVARDADFSWLLHNTTSTTTQTRLPRPAFGTYYARVQAVTADGSTGPFSLVQPFIVTDQWIINDGSPVKTKDAGAATAH